MMVRPISTQDLRGKGCLVAFSAVLVVLAGFFVVIATVRPAIAVLRARSWEPHSCVVLSSALRTNRSSSGDTFGLDVRYRWDHGGRTFEGTRYDLVGSMSSSREHWTSLLDTLKPSQVITCYVNSQAPSVAVIHRGIPEGYMAFTALTSALLLVGVLGLVHVVRLGRPRGRGEPTRIEDSLKTPGTSIPERPGPIPLQPRTSRRARLLVAAPLAVIWNGLVWLGALGSAFEVADGTAGWSQLLWFIPFVAVGIWLAYRFLQAAMTAMLPKIQMFQVDQRARLGQPLSIRWEIAPSPRRRVPFDVTLLGQEAVTYSGTDNSGTTRRSEFKRLPFVQEETGDHGQGSATVLVPADTVPSLKAGDNEIEWVVVVDATFGRWPPVREDFPITVLPPSRA